jgi:peptide/nickel transport system substrate-binding protein
MKKTLFLLLAFVVVISLLLVACGEKETTPATTAAPTTAAPTTKPPTTAAPTTAPTTAAPTTPAAPTGEKYGGVFKYPLGVAPARPIGYLPEAAPDSYTCASPACESLIRIKADGSIVGVLATSWKVAEDGRSITLELRKGVKFHDGSDFNADVCLWNLQTQIDSKQSGARNWTSVEKVNDYAVRINIAQYQNTALTGLAGGTTQQHSKEFLEKNGADAARWHPVGTGPFIFDNYERDSKLTYKRNPNYWEAGIPYLDGVQFIVISDETVRKLAFQKGDIHHYGPLSLLVAKELEDTGQYNLSLGGGGPYVLVPDSMNPKSPWANVNVRFAASYAIDRETIADAVGFGFASASYQFFQTFPELNVPGLVKTEYDQAKAKSLLRDAGYPTGFKTVIHRFTRMVPADYINAVASYLREVGIDATHDSPTSAKYEEYRYGTWDGLCGHGVAAFENKNQSFSFYFTGLQFQYCKKPAGWQEGLDASLTSLEPDPKLIQNVIEIMYNDMMVISYLEQKAFAFTQKGVHDDTNGSYNTGAGVSIAPWQYLWLDESAR